MIDGADGSGKATQVALLAKRLRHEGYQVKTIDFPQYYDNFFGKFIGGCLKGEHGDFIAIDPYIVSTLYAADRFESKARIEKWLKTGYIVVADRYVSANQLHQGGKIHNGRERKKFLRWLDEMEFGVFGLPRPDAILYLDVPLLISKQLLSTKEAQQKKQYLKKGKDQAEEDDAYLIGARESAVKMVRQHNRWIRVICTAKGELLSKEIISERVWQKLRGIM